MSSNAQMLRRFPASITILLATLCLATLGAELSRFTLEDIASVQPVGQTALSPDGKTVAMLRSGQVLLLPAAGGWPITLTTSPGGKSGLSWCPDGSRIAYASQGSIWTVAVKGGQPRRLTRSLAGAGDPRQSGDRDPQWSPKGKWILFETGRRAHEDLMIVSEDRRSESYLTSRDVESESPSCAPD